MSYSSHEGANAPELVIVTSGGPTHTPTATATPSQTATTGSSPTPTRTPTPGPTNTATVIPTTPPSSFQSAEFDYDGDGKRVKSTINGTITTYFVGTHYELTGSTITKYYYAGAQRIAMRSNGTLNYLLGDHLGSTSLVTDASGNNGIETRYKAWGEVRYASGNVPTKYQYTGQYSYESDFGLDFYGARWYDSSLGRFTQADNIIPSAMYHQAWDRYAYTFNNPLLYTDPTGHDPILDFFGGLFKELARTNFWWHPGYQRDLAIKNNESTAELTGRLVADVASMAIGVVEAGGGTGVAAGGVVVCVTGVGCLAGAPAVAAGGVLIAQGAGTTLSAANGFGTVLAALSSNNPGSSSSDDYPKIIDPRTNNPIPKPSSDLQWVPEDQRIPWSNKERGEFISEWYDRGYTTPKGGWADYDIHHIIPREYGGTNDFWNLVPVKRRDHQQLLNPWWNRFTPR